MPELKSYLDKKLQQYNRQEFIASDPIQVPHLFSKKEDIEIAAFLTATIAWGNRKMIINNALRLMNFLNNSPYDFILNKVPDYNTCHCGRSVSEAELLDPQSLEKQSFRPQGEIHCKQKEIFSLRSRKTPDGRNDDKFQAINNFVHRTFNGYDCMFFLLSLKRIYTELGGLENVFNRGFSIDNTIFSALKFFRKEFLYLPHNKRVERHLSDVEKKSAAKRLNMFLRWMVRKDENGVDFGLWRKIPTSALMLPLDVHAGNVSRQLGILNRKQNDWKAVEEVTENLRKFCPEDPVKYDFALFGSGVFQDREM